MNTGENYLHIKNEMISILKECGRNEEDCKLIAVSKTKPISDMMPVYEAGCRGPGNLKKEAGDATGCQMAYDRASADK